MLGEPLSARAKRRQTHAILDVSSFEAISTEMRDFRSGCSRHSDGDVKNTAKRKDPRSILKESPYAKDVEEALTAPLGVGLREPMYALPDGRYCRTETIDAPLLEIMMGKAVYRGIASMRSDSSTESDSTNTSGSSRTQQWAPRLTIFSDSFVKFLSEKRGGDINHIVRSTAGRILQLAVFALMVMFLGCTPLVKEAALWDPEQQKKVQNFVPQTPYIVHFFASVVIANFASWSLYGKIGVKDCWDIKSVIFVSRASIFYAVGESMEMFTLLFIDGTTWKILNQLKLPVTATINYLFLGRQQTPTQWSLIVAVSITIIGYCSAKQSVAMSTDISQFGLALGTVNVLIVAFAGTVADVTYKQVKYPFFILVAQGRLSACFLTYLTMVGYLMWTGTWRRFFDGWNFRVIFLCCWLLLKDWSVTFVLRNLDSMWKAIGTAMGLCVTYVLSDVIIKKDMEFLVSIFVLLVVVNIVAYTCSKAEMRSQDKSSKA